VSIDEFVECVAEGYRQRIVREEEASRIFRQWLKVASPEANLFMHNNEVEIINEIVRQMDRGFVNCELALSFVQVKLPA
jgi:hypothetical protein